MYTGCVDSLYRGRRGPPYRVGHAEPFGTSRYEANLYIVRPPIDPLPIARIALRISIDHLLLDGSNLRFTSTGILRYIIFKNLPRFHALST